MLNNKKIANYSQYQFKNESIHKEFLDIYWLVTRYDKVDQDVAYPALKRLFKYARYLDELELLTAGHETDLIEWCSLIRMKEYQRIINAFDTLFSEKDWDNAERYFETHPDETYAGSNNKLMYSYIKSDSKIFRRNIKPLGEGAYGRVTYSALRDNSDRIVTKRQSSDVKEFDMKDCDLEAEINRNLGIAYSDLIVRRKPDIINAEHGDIYKVYQVMHYLGEPLLKVLPSMSLKVKIDYAIKLILAVHDLHIGNNGGKPYVHCDIKPENILINTKDNTLHLIDFGLAVDTLLDQPVTPHRGSRAYFPRNLEDDTFVFETTPFFNDKIAALRTIYFPINKYYRHHGILNHEEFIRFPTTIQSLLNTTRIRNVFNKNTSWTLRLIASVLILYKDNQIINKATMNLLVENKAQQSDIIDCYTKNLPIPEILNIPEEDELKQNAPQEQRKSWCWLFRPSLPLCKEAKKSELLTHRSA